jgi:hypothetical protein
MEDFTLAELKNIARDEGLSGWSKFKKEHLWDFLIKNNVNVKKQKLKHFNMTAPDSVVTQALDENVQVFDQDLNVKTKKELCKTLAKKKKGDIVQQALEFNIDINRPNGKPKTIKELLEDIALKLLVDQQIVIEVPSDNGGSYQPSARCLKRKKKDVITEALALGINIVHPNGKVKTVKELCIEIELIVPPSAAPEVVAASSSCGINAMPMGISKVSATQQIISGFRNAQTVATRKEYLNTLDRPSLFILAEHYEVPNYENKNIKEIVNDLVYKTPSQDFFSGATVQENPVITECVITDEGNEICLNTKPDNSAAECVTAVGSGTECVITPNGDVACNNPQEEICVVAQVCTGDNTTGEETCVPVNVCAEQQPVLVPSFNTRRVVDIQDIENQLVEITNPITSFNQSIIGVKETVFKSLGLI